MTLRELITEAQELASATPEALDKPLRLIMNGWDVTWSVDTIIEDSEGRLSLCIIDE